MPKSHKKPVKHCPKHSLSYMVAFLSIAAIAAGVMIGMYIKTQNDDGHHFTRLKKLIHLKQSVILLTDKTCTSCVDIEPIAEGIKEKFKNVKVKKVDIDSYRGRSVLKSGIKVVPAVLFPAKFAKSGAPEVKAMLESGQLSLINDRYAELFIPGNKRILDESKLPKTEQVDGKVVVVSYISPFCEDCIDFVNDEWGKVQAKYGDKALLDLRFTPVGGDPVLIAAEATVCALKQKDGNFAVALNTLYDKRDDYFSAIKDATELKVTDERETALRTSLVSILGDDIQECLAKHEGCMFQMHN